MKPPAHETVAPADGPLRAGADGHWKQRPEGGGRVALWLIRTIALRLGRAPARLLLFPITAYFLLVRGPERRASRAYLSRVFGRPATWREVARHVHCFASTILDRVFLLTDRGRGFDIRIHGHAALDAEVDRGRGVLLLGAHLGSFDALRALSRLRPDLLLRVVLDKAQNPALTELLDALAPDIADTVIDAGQPGTAIVLALQDAAAAGAVIGLLADRARPGDAALPVPFLGAPAPLPTAPMLIAGALQIPVVLCFGLYRGGRRYDLHFEPFSPGLALPRPQRQALLVQALARYAQRLEHYARLAPYNWFNFYDFWNSHAHPPAASLPAPATTSIARGAAGGGAAESGAECADPRH